MRALSHLSVDAHFAARPLEPEQQPCHADLPARTPDDGHVFSGSTLERRLQDGVAACSIVDVQQDSAGLRKFSLAACTSSSRAPSGSVTRSSVLRSADTGMPVWQSPA
jgi:hypothetical protein